MASPSLGFMPFSQTPKVFLIFNLYQLVILVASDTSIIINLEMNTSNIKYYTSTFFVVVIFLIYFNFVIDWMCVSSKNPYVEVLIPSVMVFGSGVFVGN